MLETGSLIVTVALLKGRLRESDCAAEFFTKANEKISISKNDTNILSSGNILFI